MMEEGLNVLLPKNRFKAIFNENILTKCCEEMLLLYLTAREGNYDRYISCESTILN